MPSHLFFERHPFSFQRLEEALRFVDEFSVTPQGSTHVRILCEKVIEEAETILDLYQDDTRMAFAALIDNCHNMSDAGEFEVFAVRPCLESNVLLGFALEQALQMARAREHRSGLEITDYGQINEFATLLKSYDFKEAYRMFLMTRTGKAVNPEIQTTLPDDWFWVEASEILYGEFYNVTVSAFSGVRGANISSFESFAERCWSSTGNIRLLLDGQNHVAGFVRVLLDEIVAIGRRPDCRGMELGNHIMGEAVRLLGEKGYPEIHLNVNAENKKALALYRKFGFEVIKIYPVYYLRIAS